MTQDRDIADGLLRFPPEIRQHVFYYCSKSDLVNVACCSKTYYNCVKYLLWDEIHFSWKNDVFSGAKYDLPKALVANLKLTTTLRFNLDYNDNEFNFDNIFIPLRFRKDNTIDSDNSCYSDDDDGSLQGSAAAAKCTQKHKEVTYTVHYNYLKILSFCNPTKLISLHIDAVIDNHCLKETAHILPNLREFSLSNVSLVYFDTWKCLAKLKQLKKLSLEECDIEDSSVKEIIAATKLEDIALNRCLDIREESLTYISGTKLITRFALSHNSSILSHSFKCLGNLVNLVKLDLVYTNLDDEAFSYICMRCTDIKRLSIYGSENLTDTGFHCIANLPRLIELNIDRCTNITENGVSCLKKVALQKLSFGWSNNISDSVFEHLCNISSLTEVHVGNINNRFSVVAIDNFCKKVNMKKKSVLESWIFSFFTLEKN